MSKDELDNIALESTCTSRSISATRSGSITLVPDGKVGHDAYAVIRKTIRQMAMVAIGHLVLTSREHILALEPLKIGLMGTLLRYCYEVRGEDEYSNEIRDIKLTKDMVDLAQHIVALKAFLFDPENSRTATNPR